MASPFPGMDPYLERHWGDVHARLIIYASDELNKALPRDLRARVEERVFVETPEGERPIVPDVRILKRAIPGKKKPAAGAATSVATAEPLIVPLDEPITEGYIEIRDISAGHRVITVIEVLSPSNKTSGDARNIYLHKQQELFEGQVSLVEIDLLRSGKPLWPFPFHTLPAEHQTLYGVCVTRSWKLTQVDFYPIPLREPLPTIRVPLRQSDGDAPLNLQQLIEQCYENGSYTDDIDYRDDPDPPLPAVDTRWADALLRKQGKRPRNGAAGRRGRRNGKR
jgi:hypothetical protein